MRRRTTILTIITLALVVVVAGTVLGVLYGAGDEAQATGAPATVTSVCDPSCVRQGACDRSCDQVGACGNGTTESCPMMGGAKCGGRASGAGGAGGSCPMAGSAQSSGAASGECCDQ